MTKRFKNALSIVNPGACNPSGIAHSIVEACAELRDEGAGTATICADPAVRLMIYQLGGICGLALGLDANEYAALVKECHARS